MEAVILILGLLFVAFMALGVYVSVKVDRRGEAWRGPHDHAGAPHGRGDHAAGEELRPGGSGRRAGPAAARRCGRRCGPPRRRCRRASAEDASLSESLGLFQRLSVHGRELDDELKRLEREPDRATVASLLPGLKQRTERITHSAESLRWAARDRARQFADDDLAALNTQIDVEAGALRHWTVEEPSAGAGAAVPVPVRRCGWRVGATGRGVRRPARKARRRSRLGTPGRRPVTPGRRPCGPRRPTEQDGRPKARARTDVIGRGRMRPEAIGSDHSVGVGLPRQRPGR